MGNACQKQNMDVASDRKSLESMRRNRMAEKAKRQYYLGIDSVVAEKQM